MMYGVNDGEWVVYNIENNTKVLLVERSLVEECNSSFGLKDYVGLKRRRTMLVTGEEESHIDKTNNSDGGGGGGGGGSRLKNGDIDESTSTWSIASSSYLEAVDLFSSSSNDTCEAEENTTHSSSCCDSSHHKFEYIFDHFLSGCSDWERSELMTEKQQRQSSVLQRSSSNPFIYTFKQSCECQVLSDHDIFFKKHGKELSCIKSFNIAVAMFASDLYLELNGLEEDDEENEDDLTPFGDILEVFIRRVFTAANEMSEDIVTSCRLLR